MSMILRKKLFRQWYSKCGTHAIKWTSTCSHLMNGEGSSFSVVSSSRRDRICDSGNSCDPKRVLGHCRLPRFGRRGSGTIKLRCQSRIWHVECGRIIL